MMRRAVRTLAPVLLLWACSESETPSPTEPPDAAHAETAVEPARIGAAVPGEWIVVFEPTANVAALTRQIFSAQGGQLQFVYDVAIKGFAARLPDAAVTALRNHPAVAYIEPNRWGGIVATQNNPTWGLDRIDQNDLPLSNTYTYNRDGTGVNVYVLDTGVRLSHNEFGGRARYIPNGNNGDFVNDGRGNAADCHGHGTHVAGTAAGTTYGVAKNAAIWAGRVVNCAGGGTVAMAIAGVDWITANGEKPGVVNMSLGYGDVQSLRDAVQNSIAAGFVYSVAAGNGDFFGNPMNACDESPAGAPDALTVGATSITDDEAYFSNFGPCVDILAPGVNVESAWHTGNNATNTISGTSMATPHVTGAAALYLEANPTATPAQVANALRNNAIVNTIDLHDASENGGTANRFLYTGFIGGGGPAPKPPAAAFQRACSGGVCTFDDTSTDPDGSVVAWEWDFGDGTSSTLSSPSHTYSGGGPYTVRLTVTDNDGLTSSTTLRVDPPGGSNRPPAVTFRWSCSGRRCTFQALGGDADGTITSRSWNFGDGGTASGSNPSHTFASNGTYVVTLAVTDNDGARHWQSIPVEVGTSNEHPLVTFYQPCAGLVCDFSDRSTDSDGTIRSRYWEFGDGATSTARNPDHTYAAPGTYHVTLTVTDNDGAVHRRTRQLQVTRTTNSPPSAGFTSKCTELACSFTDTSTDSDGTIASWRWSFGDGSTASARNPSHTYGSPGTYDVTLTVTDDDGATDSVTRQVTVDAPSGNSAPSAAFEHSCGSRACGFHDTSTDSDGSIVSWRWDFGDGTASDQPAPAHTFASAGAHTVRLTVTDNDGATDTRSMTINVPATGAHPPTTNFRLSCSGLRCDFEALPGGGSSWSWDFGDGGSAAGASPSHTFPSAGTYLVTLRSTNGGGRTSWQAIPVSVGGSNDVPFASYTAPCSGLTCDFTDYTRDSDGTIVSWFWEFGDGATSTARNPDHTYAAAGAYFVRLTVVDDAGATHARTRLVQPN